ncbi:MAG: DUF192 domain-containing protein [Candidatus Eremiobacteraeota bacterium]|nr:DUF192 domain-containing protein [Candidatus Eremiobacteraeota bacterium]
MLLTLNVAQMPPLQQPQAGLHLLAVRAPKATLRLQVADNQAARQRGLMFRTTLEPHTGMIFVFDSDADVAFWMKNTLIALDLVFLGADGRVRSLSANVPAPAPQTPDAAIARRTGRAKFVLELPGGEAARDGLKRGARVRGLVRLH